MSAPGGDCPKCNTRNTYAEKNCNMCGELLPWAQQPSMPAPVSPAAGNFVRCSQAEIEEAAKKALKKPTKQNGMALSVVSFGTAGIGIVIGFVLLLVPIIGWIVGPLFIITSFCFGIASFIPGLVGFAKSPNAQELTGKIHQYQRMMRGNCPICKSLITIMPVEDKGNVACPSCHQMLAFDELTVAAK